jgi:hypothetical protein
MADILEDFFNHGGHGEHGGEEEFLNGKAFDAVF